jgi:hypothetical protein
MSGRTRLPAPANPGTPSDGPRRVVRVRLRTFSGDVTVERAE